MKLRLRNDWEDLVLGHGVQQSKSFVWHVARTVDISQPDRTMAFVEFGSRKTILRSKPLMHTFVEHLCRLRSLSIVQELAGVSMTKVACIDSVQSSWSNVSLVSPNHRFGGGSTSVHVERPFERYHRSAVLPRRRSHFDREPERWRCPTVVVEF